MRKTPRALLLALFFPSLLLSPNAFDLNLPHRHGRPLGLSSPTAQFLPHQLPKRSPHRQLHGLSRSSSNIHSTEHVADALRTTADHTIFNPFEVPEQQMQEAKVPWILTAVVLLLGQLGSKWSNGMSLNPSSVAARATSCFSNMPVLYSAVSASLLKRQKVAPGSLTINFSMLMRIITVASMIWQLGGQAELIFSVATLYGSRFVNWYTGILTTAPLVTKAITTAVIGLMGDTGAQLVEERIHAKKQGRHTTTPWFRSYDTRRGLSVVGDGVFVSGPVLHVAYNCLENLIPISGGGMAATIAAMLHVLIDVFVLDAFAVATRFVTTGFAEGYAQQILSQFREDYPAAVKASWATSFCFMPLQFLIFRFLPLQFRVLGINLIDIAWEAMVSYIIHQRLRKFRMETQAATMVAVGAVGGGQEIP